MKKIIRYVFIPIGVIITLFAIQFFVVRKLDRNYSESLEAGLTKTDLKPLKLPSMFLDSARFLVKLPLESKDTLLAYCDTGGGISMLMPSRQDRPEIAPYVKKGLVKGLMPMSYVTFNDMVNIEKFPSPSPIPNFILRKPFVRVQESYLVIPPLTHDLQQKIDKMPMLDAFLGQGFFMGRAWTFDYPKQEVWVNTPIKSTDSIKPNVLSLGFKKNTHGVAVYGHPRMQIEIEGEEIEVLFDTGASFVLSDKGKDYFNTEKNTLAGSFIAASIFDQWRIDHPDWKYYPESDGSQGIIEVPVVKIAGHEVGPVLFSRRPDHVWSEMMAQSMDKVVKGAIGGSLLKHFKVKVDYNSELIQFQKYNDSTLVDRL
ncbi:hypothetical protein [Flagellimonas sp.]|uniref:hypothetical protein n=1 Tax=Flagellimonas sp. TaxID=2058762 RepID=UPI003BAAF7CD